MHFEIYLPTTTYKHMNVKEWWFFLILQRRQLKKDFPYSKKGPFVGNLKRLREIFKGWKNPVVFHVVKRWGQKHIVLKI